MFRRRPRRPSSAPEPIDAAELAAEYLRAGDPIGWFEDLYQRARRQPAAVPWASSVPHPYLCDWLDDPVVKPSGTRAIVVGCGLGDDAVEVERHGFEVTAFDISAEAVAWSRERFEHAAVDWRTEDLLQLPDAYLQGFDLVVEVGTVAFLPGVVRDAAMQAIGSLTAPGGVVVAVTLLATADDRRGQQGPPWAQAPSELAAYRAAGLERVSLEHPDTAEDGVMEVRITLRRTAGDAADAMLPLLR